MKYKIVLILGLFAVAPMQITQAQDVLNVVDSEVTSVNELVFTEGPAYHRDGSVFYTDIQNNRIMRLAPGARNRRHIPSAEWSSQQAYV